MTGQTVVSGAAADTPTAASRLDFAGRALLLAFIFAIPLSVAASGMLLTALTAVWLGRAAATGERLSAPAFFWPAAAYAGWTLVTVPFSLDPLTSLIESKEILLFLVIPIVYRAARGPHAWTTTHVVLGAGAVIAVIGIVQYGILEFDNLGQRPRGSMGHYMTYSGLLMLIIGVTVSRLLFSARDRVWALIVLPALTVALAVTLTRSAWIGACAGVGVLFVLKDLRLLVLAPVLAGLFFLFAPAQITDRALATFDLRDPTNRDRLAMVTVGVGMVRDHPILGVGPEMVQEAYAEYRPANAVNETNQHLHNVPLQIAAERGLPALALWGWFIVAVVADLLRRIRQPEQRTLAAAGLAAVAAMLSAGMFEYNFGDSEFLMLLLVLITLPAAAAWRQPAES